jgi:hypothetical protein
MYTKKKTIEEIKAYTFREFTDKYGRVTLHPASHNTHEPGSWDSENVLLWTGEYYLLLDRLNGLDKETGDRLLSGIRACEVPGVTGLYNAHPNDPKEHEISWDNYVGVVIAGGFFAFGVVVYGELHNWAFINERPMADGLTVYDGKVEGRKFFPFIHRIRQWKERAFYRMIAGEDVGFFELLMFALNAIMTVHKSTYHGMDNYHQTSGKIIQAMKFMAIELYSRHKNNWLVRMSGRYFMWRLRRLYGDKPIYKLFTMYFNVIYNGQYHPLVQLAEHLEG